MPLKLGILFLFVFVFLLSGCEKTESVAVQEEFLPVEKAFVFNVKAAGKNQLTAHWDIAEGYHLYKNKFEFSLANNDYQISTLNMPKGEMILDEVFGDQESYKGSLDITIALKALNDSGNVVLQTKYQGCSEKGLCYPPQKVKSVITL